MNNNHTLVSVGIPTYNRPDGLRNTLRAITNQTFKNIEIVVSDNCSENPLVQEVIEEFKKMDSRIVSFRQQSNIGISNNFKFVLKKASGDFFMWAADDDDWEPGFIEELMSIIGTHSAAFCNYSVSYRSTGTSEDIIIIQSASGASKYQQARNFLIERVPSMFYSIYKKEDINWFLDIGEIFDWFDCYVIFRTILLAKGFIFSKKLLYTAGISGAQYENKPFTVKKNGVYSYKEYLKRSIKIIQQSNLSPLEKFKLFFYLIEANMQSFLSIETKRKSYRTYFYMYKVYSFFAPKVSFIRLY